jgi:hypothetical protein
MSVPPARQHPKPLTLLINKRGSLKHYAELRSAIA